MMTNKKFDCYTCEYRGSVPGTHHICCHHPSIDRVHDNPLLALVGILASAGRIPFPQVNNEILNIKGNPHGIRNGWFVFPVCFDPVWLENCDGYKIKGGSEDGEKESTGSEDITKTSGE